MPAWARIMGRAKQKNETVRQFSFSNLVLGNDETRKRDNETQKKHTKTHHDEKPRAESTQVQHGGARGTLDKVVRVRAVAAYPVGHGRQHVRGHDEERVVGLP